jgi:hypothetical protein
MSKRQFYKKPKAERFSKVLGATDADRQIVARVKKIGKLMNSRRNEDALCRRIDWEIMCPKTNELFDGFTWVDTNMRNYHHWKEFCSDAFAKSSWVVYIHDVVGKHTNGEVCIDADNPPVDPKQILDNTDSILTQA